MRLIVRDHTCWSLASPAVIAIVAAFWFAGCETSDARAWMKAVEEAKLKGELAGTQWQRGSPLAARQAMSDYLVYLESVDPLHPSGWGAGQHPFLDSRGLAFDRMLASARVAILEERLGNRESARAKWRAASDYAQAAGVPDTSAPAIRATVERLDVAIRK